MSRTVRLARGRVAPRAAQLAVLLTLALTPALAAQPDMTLIGAPANPADTNGLGAVADEYRLGSFEVSNAEYLAFLEAVAVTDPNGLYSPLMESSDRGGIEQSGSPGSFTYTIKLDFADKPVVAINWFDAARYCNWLHNGMRAGNQSAATTEDGAYDMSLGAANIVRKPGALWFLPTHDEWYKAAYYDPIDPGADANGTPDYWSYPTRSDAAPLEATADASGNVTNPGPNVANTDKGADWNGENGNVTTLGGCSATSPWGLFDLGGNANEVTETPGNTIPGPPPLPTRILRGGDFSNTGVLMLNIDAVASSLNMLAEGANIGFRVASLRPWTDLGSALGGGGGGPPQLETLGTLAGGTLVRFTLREAPAGAPATLIAGISALNATFKGGTMVPGLDVIFPAQSVLPDGTRSLAVTWPTGLGAGIPVYAQYWISDPSGPVGFLASNAVMNASR